MLSSSMPKYPQSQPRWHPGRWSLYRRSLPGYAGCGWLSGNAIAAPIKSKLHKMCSLPPPGPGLGVTCGHVLSSMSSASSLLSQGGGCLIMCPQQPQGTLYCMSVPMSSDTLWGTSGRIHRGPGHGQFVCNDAWRGWGLVPHSNSS